MGKPDRGNMNKCGEQPNTSTTGNCGHTYCGASFQTPSDEHYGNRFNCGGNWNNTSNTYNTCQAGYRCCKCGNWKCDNTMAAPAPGATTSALDSDIKRLAAEKAAEMLIKAGHDEAKVS